MQRYGGAVDFLNEMGLRQIYGIISAALCPDVPSPPVKMPQGQQKSAEEIESRVCKILSRNRWERKV